MKKSYILLAAGLLAIGATSCKQEDEPRVKKPTHFTVYTPALQNQEIETATQPTSNATINIFCSQPDYGFSAICTYSVICSLDPTCPEVDTDLAPDATPKSIAIPSVDGTLASMAISSYKVGVAMNKMSGVLNEEVADLYPSTPLAQGPVEVYFRAVCEIPGVEGTRVVSDNVVSYKAIKAPLTVEVPGWMYICGDIANLETGELNGFKAPSGGNEELYITNWALYEPKSMVDQGIYVGTFGLQPKEDTGAGVDDTSNFRFFTELLGWTKDASLGSNEADFFKMDITAQAESASGFNGDIVYQGLGNWGIFNFTGEYQPVTIVVDVPKLKVYIKTGDYNVDFDGRDPIFEAKAE